jgi:hypothetical protein
MHPVLITSLPYGYQPDQGINALFLAIFTSGIIGFGLVTFWTRRWLAFNIPLIFACLLEVIGYGVRVGSTAKPSDLRMYTATTVLLTIGPSIASMG